MNDVSSYKCISTWSQTQELAGVDREVRELFVAYARLSLDAGKRVPDFGALDLSATTTFSIRDVPPSPALDHADPRFLAFIASYSRAMIGRRLPVFLSVSHMAKKMRLPLKQLVWMSWHQESGYRRFSVPKPSGGERIIDAPVEKLKTLQGWIHRRILSGSKLHRCATGFRRGMSIVDNAARHARKRVVVRIDLKDFFPTITHRQARKAFERLGYPYSVAALLANLCTLHGVLPQGAPTSPTLANLVCRDLDERLYRLSRKWKCRYSRYADDLVFSSNNERMPDLIPFIKQVIREEGFIVNEEKVRVMRKGSRQKVTGLVVNKTPNVPRTTRRLLRAMMHRVAMAGASALEVNSVQSPNADPLHVLQGRMSFLRMVSPQSETSIMLAAEKSRTTLRSNAT